MNDLIPSTLLSEIPDLYASENETDPLVRVKLFTPDSNWSWFVTEVSQSDGDTCFGLVVGLEVELGYFSLSELSQVRGVMGSPVERDLYFTPKPLSEVQKEVAHVS